MHDFFVIGHRGAAGEQFENSLSGFKHALALDIDAIELDIQAHSGELWVIHDQELNRLTRSTGRFDSCQDPGSLRLLNDEPIPKLGEVLDLYWGKMPINIEIKSPDTASMLLELLEQYPVIGQESAFPWILISSFDHAQINDLKRLSSRWELAPIISRIPVNTLQLIDEIKPYSLHMDDKYLDYTLIQQVQQQGVRVMIFTVNDSKHALDLKKTGIDGIFTDYPSVFTDID